MKNPNAIIACSITVKKMEEIECVLFSDENKAEFLRRAIDREIVRRTLNSYKIQ